MEQEGFFSTPRRYVPATLSEIDDLLGSMILGAPTFKDRTGYFPNKNVDSEFLQLTDGLEVVRKKLGEDRYVKMIDIAARAKALFLDDQEDKNGKTDQGRDLLFELEDLLNEARRRRVEAKLPDDEGRVTGD